jgi:hypothetical protein
VVFAVSGAAGGTAAALPALAGPVTLPNGAVTGAVEVLLALLGLLLLISLAAIVAAPAWSPPPQADRDAQQPRPVTPGQVSAPRHSRADATANGVADLGAVTAPGLPFPEPVVRRPRVSGGPPWGPAPRPPGV